jgi:hypothetical protein
MLQQVEPALDGRLQAAYLFIAHGLIVVPRAIQQTMPNCRCKTPLQSLISDGGVYSLRFSAGRQLIGAS